MVIRTRSLPLALGAMINLALCLTGIQPVLSQTAAKPAIYNPKADIKAEIAGALKTAAKDHKRILLMFGGNWCPWCHKLHKLFETDEAIRTILQQHYILIMVDVGEKAGAPLNRDLVERYRVEGFGYPSLAVLDARGKLVCTQNSAALEKGPGHDPARVLSFLEVEALHPQPAE